MLLALLLAGCANNPAILSSLYNRVDDFIARAFTRYAEFDDEQKAWIKQAAFEWQDWHRRSEMPRYAEFLRGLRRRLVEPDLVAREDVVQWFATLEGFARTMGECNPLYQSEDFLRGLSDEQLDQIAQRIEEENEKDRQEFARNEKARSSGEKYRERRLKSMKSSFALIGFKLDESQEQFLRETIAKEYDLSAPGREAEEKWSLELVSLLRDRAAPDFESQVIAHLRARATMLDPIEPEKQRANRELWVDAVTRLVNEQTPEQRESFSQWLAFIAETLDLIVREPGSAATATAVSQEGAGSGQAILSC